MTTQTQTSDEQGVSKGQLWFGFTAAVSAWIVTGLADTIIAWRACFRNEELGGTHNTTGWLVACIAITLLLFVIACVGGVISYRNLKHLAGGAAEKSDSAKHSQFLAITGVYISFTLAVGIVWFGLPLGILSFCVRTR